MLPESMRAVTLTQHQQVKYKKKSKGVMNKPLCGRRQKVCLCVFFFMPSHHSD